MDLGGGVRRQEGVEEFELLDDMGLDLVALVHASPHAHQSEKQ